MTEAEVVRACRNILDILRAHHLLEYRIISVPSGNRPTDRLHSQMMAGMPDCQLYLRGGVTINLEFKSSIGKQCPVQKEWQKDLMALGHHYFIAKSTDELINVLAMFRIDVTRHTWMNAPVI